jgi:hypothetical protein
MKVAEGNHPLLPDMTRREPSALQCARRDHIWKEANESAIPCRTLPSGHERFCSVTMAPYMPSVKSVPSQP